MRNAMQGRGSVSYLMPPRVSARPASALDEDGDTEVAEERETPQQQAAEPYEAPLGIDDLIAMFEDAEMATISARALSERCRDYYDNKQLTAEERLALAARGQPEIVRNQIKGKVNFWLGFEAKNRSDPRAESEQGTSEDEASAASDMLRFQERRGKLDQKFSDTWEHMLIEGFGGIEVLGPSKKDPRVIEVKRWKWDRLFYDPASSEHDFSDATYNGGVIWMDKDAALTKFAQFPEAKAAIETAGTAGPSQTLTYDDKPHHVVWMQKNGKRVRVRIVQMYYLVDDEWHWCLFTYGGIITSGPVELKDEQGHTVNPLLMQALYVDRENNRYGEVAEFLATQDEINKRASKALHLANSSLTLGEQGAGLDIDDIKAQKARPDGHITLPPGGMDKFKFAEHDTAVAQHREMMMDATAAIEKRGPNASLLGTESHAPSGRAIRANQEGGMVEGARPRDRYNSLKERVYQALWQRVRQFTTEETWIAVTGEDDAVKYVGFNRPVTAAQKLVNDARQQGMADDEIKARMQQLVQSQPGALQALQQVVGHENVPMEMDLNVIIEQATESVTLAQESFELLSQRRDVPFEMLLEFWPGNGRQKKRMREWIEKNKQAQASGANAKVELEVDEAKAKIEKTRADAILSMARADVLIPTPTVPPIDGPVSQPAPQPMQGMAPGAPGMPPAPMPQPGPPGPVQRPMQQQPASPYGAAGLA